MPGVALVLDANILIRFAIGRQVPRLLATYVPTVDFLAPDIAFVEARQNLPAILRARGHAGAGEMAALEALDAAAEIVTSVSASSYEPMRAAALARIGQRDPDDWLVLACALLLNCPIRTEDQAFFGTGVATWTTALVELYLNEAKPGSAGQ